MNLQGQPVRAALYARVSSARQREEQTISSQIEALRVHAREAGWAVPAEWVFADDGVSGATLARPALDRLRDLVTQVPVPVVLVYAPDRLARRYAYQVLLVEELSRAGTEVRFVRGPRADSPEDLLLVQFQGMIAEYEKAQILERTRRGKAHKARQGVVNVLSAAPYGYRYVRRSDTADARYEIVEQQAAVVRDLFERYTAGGCSIGDLARGLGERGVPTATGKAVWDRSTVWAILRNPAYKGEAALYKTRVDGAARPKRNRTHRVGAGTAPQRGGRIDRPARDWVTILVPPIITPETFELAAARLETNKRFARRATIEPTLCQSLVACAACGYSYYRTSTRTTARRIYYYRCLGADAWRWPEGARCQARPLRADHVDSLVWDHVAGLLADPQLIVAELDRRLADLRATSPARASRARLDTELARARNAQQRLLTAYTEDLLTLDELRRTMPDLRQREQQLRDQLTALDAAVADEDTYLALADSINTFTRHLTDAVRDADITARQAVVRLLVHEVLVDHHRLVIRHSIPTRPPPAGHTTPSYLLRGSSPLTAVGQHRPVRAGRALRTRVEALGPAWAACQATSRRGTESAQLLDGRILYVVACAHEARIQERDFTSRLPTDCGDSDNSAGSGR